MKVFLNYIYIFTYKYVYLNNLSEMVKILKCIKKPFTRTKINLSILWGIDFISLTGEQALQVKY